MRRFLLALLLLAACTPAHFPPRPSAGGIPLGLYWKGEPPAGYRTVGEEAARRWNEGMGVRLFVWTETVGLPVAVFPGLLYSDKAPGGIAYGLSGTLAETHLAGGMPEAWRLRVIAHELGHVLGVDHSDAPLDLMHPTPTVDHPTTRDLERARASLRERGLL